MNSRINKTQEQVDGRILPILARIDDACLGPPN